jgi:hypothetical protein
MSLRRSRMFSAAVSRNIIFYNRLLLFPVAVPSHSKHLLCSLHLSTSIFTLSEYTGAGLSLLPRTRIQALAAARQ